MNKFVFAWKINGIALDGCKRIIEAKFACRVRFDVTCQVTDLNKLIEAISALALQAKAQRLEAD